MGGESLVLAISPSWYGQGPMLRVKTKKKKLRECFFAHRAQSTRSLHCAQYAIKLHWTELPMRILGKTTNTPFVKNVKLENKYPADISAKFPCKVNGVFFQHAVQCNFCETAFTCFVNTKKDLHDLGPTNWRASKNHRAVWMAVSSYKVHCVSQMWKQCRNVGNFRDKSENCYIFCCKILFLKRGKS